MKLSPWKTKVFHSDCCYYTVTNTVKYGVGLHSVYEEELNDTDGWVDVSDLTGMRVWEFEELNKKLEFHFGVTVNSSGTIRLCKNAPPLQYDKEL